MLKYQREQVKIELHNYNNHLTNHYHYLKSKKNMETQKFRSPKNYTNDMVDAIQDLGFKNPVEFFKAKTRKELENHFRALQCSNSFRNRTQKDRDNMSSAFKAYIEFQSNRSIN